MERVFRFIILLFVFFGVLSLAGTTLTQFGKDIHFKDPYAVLNIQKPERKEQIKPQAEETKKKQTEEKVAKKETKKVETKKSDKVTKKDVEKLISTIPVAKKQKYKEKKLDWGKAKVNKAKRDPYTDKKLSSSSEIDFIIPLSYINKYSHIKASDKKEFIKSGDNTTLTFSKNIKLKSYQPPSKWLPEENKEDYCYTYLQIASKWQISMTKEDIKTCRLEINNAIDSGRKVESLTNIKER